MTLQQWAPLIRPLFYGFVVASAVGGGVVGFYVMDTILAHRKPHAPKGTPPCSRS